MRLKAASISRAPRFFSIALQFVIMIAAVILTTIVIVPFRPVPGVTQFSALYLPVILICALLAHPSVTFFAGLLSFIFFDMVILPPQFPIHVTSPLDLLSPLAVLSVALVTGVIAERSRRRSVQMAVFRDADQLRSTLLNLVSHNLRTPLATIKTSLSAVKSTAQLPADSVQLIDDAMQACNRLNRLVTNTLRLSQLDAEKLTVQREPQAIDDLIEATFDLWRQAVAVGDLVADLPDDIPFVPLDFDLISAVLTNLIDNAFRHGKPPIVVRVTQRPNDLMVTVQDAGIGVSAEKRSELFQPFRSGRATGIGLGLAVCKGLVEAHGGSLWATFDGATCFHFTLPLGDEGADGTRTDR